MILVMKILESKFFVNFSKTLILPEFPPKFHNFILFQLLSLSLKTPKFIHVHKSSKSSDIDFQVPKKHVIQDLMHENFRVKIFDDFFNIVFY